MSQLIAPGNRRTFALKTEHRKRSHSEATDAGGCQDDGQQIVERGHFKSGIDETEYAKTTHDSDIIGGQDDDNEPLDDEDSEDDGEDAEEESENISKSSKAVDGRVSWHDEEVAKFLDICFEKHVVEKIDGVMGQNLTRVKIFKVVAKALKDCKISRKEKTYQQCREKYNKLKKIYKSTVRHNGLSGRDRKTCKFFDQLHRLFHARPAVTFCEFGFQSESGVTDVFSGDDTSTSTSTSTSNVSEAGVPQSQRKLPKYRSSALGKATPTQALAKEFMAHDREMDEKDKQWWLDQLAEQRKFDQEMFTSFQNNLGASMANAMIVGVNALKDLFSPVPAPSAPVSWSSTPLVSVPSSSVPRSPAPPAAFALHAKSTPASPRIISVTSPSSARQVPSSSTVSCPLVSPPMRHCPTAPTVSPPFKIIRVQTTSAPSKLSR